MVTHFVFGIGADEINRANRLINVYKTVAIKSGKWPVLRFPLIGEQVTKQQIDDFLNDTGIQEPVLYRMGFIHNNCSGGCVRAGKKQWKLLYEKFPDVYMERERVEKNIREYLDKDIHFFKDETLEAFRGRIESGDLSTYYNTGVKEKEVECIGICSSIA